MWKTKLRPIMVGKINISSVLFSLKILEFKYSTPHLSDLTERNNIGLPTLCYSDHFSAF